MVFGHSLIGIIKIISLVIVFPLSAWGYGYPLIRIICGQRFLDKEYYIYAIALGMGVLGHLTLGIGFFWRLNLGTAIGILAVGCILAIIQIYRERVYYFHHLHLIIDTLPAFTDIISIVLLGVVIINCLFPLFANGLVPPQAYDEIAYHLAIPKMYIQEGRINYISFMPFANWPMETEMLFTIGLLLSSELFAHIITWVDMLIICMLLIFLGKRYFNSRVGLIAAAIFSATPVITFLSGTGLIEIPLTLYSLLAMMAFLEWVQTRNSYAWMLSAVFGGLAASIKLNAALIPFLLGVLVLMVSLVYRERLKNALARFVLFGLLTLVVVSPWYVKSWIQTGNPFWGFLTGIFPTRNWDALGTSYLLDFINKPNLPLTFTNYFRAFWIITARSETIGPSTYRLGWSYLVLIPIIAVAFIIKNKLWRRNLFWLLLLSLIFYTSWFFQTHQARFLAPTIPIFALLGAASFESLLGVSNQYQKTILFAALIGILVSNSWASRPNERNLLVLNWPYFSGKMSRQTFLEERISGYLVFNYINQNLESNAYIWMALYESRGFYLERRYMWANPIAQRDIKLEKFDSADQLASILHDRGFTYILYNTINTDKYIDIQYGDKYANLINELLRQDANLIYKSDELSLYHLTPK